MWCKQQIPVSEHQTNSIMEKEGKSFFSDEDQVANLN